MNLYLLDRDAVVVGAGFTWALVAAESEDHARRTHPAAESQTRWESCLRDQAITPDTPALPLDVWGWPVVLSLIHVKLIGVASPGTLAGPIHTESVDW